MQTSSPSPSAAATAPPSRGWLTDRLQRWYLTRFSFGLGIVVVGYAPFAMWGLPAMFRSTLILSPWGLTGVTMLAVMSALTALATRRTVVACGGARFDVGWPDTGVGFTELVAHLMLPVPLVATALWFSVGEGGLGVVRAMIQTSVGAGCAAVLVVVALTVQAVVANASDELPDLLVPHAGRLLRRTQQAYFKHGFQLGVLTGLLSWIRPHVGPGYFTREGRVRQPHLFAAGIGSAYLAVYGVGYFAWTPLSLTGTAPPLAYLLVIVTLATWVLSGVSFLLDRYRLPTAMTVVGLSLVLWLISSTDHYFPLRESPTGWPPLDSPGQIAESRTPAMLAVVAVDGGGIQAAAWAGKVLSELERAWPEFHRSVRFVSAVSGGSVGTMYFINALGSGGPPSSADLDAVNALARRPSLGETAWGLAYPDLMRAFPIPFLSFDRDRGWAMEQAWRRSWAVPTLSQWVEGIGQGWRPAVALNATSVESGQRFAFATFAPPPEWHLETFVESYPGHDIDVSTAARVSATFPYVTPIARARSELHLEGAAKHLADGGYYDNTGMGIAMRWLDAALGDERAPRAHTAAFIHVRSGPVGGGSVALPTRGWLYQAIGPIETLLTVRTSGQEERAHTELTFLKRLWEARNVAIEDFEFGFDRESPPLSWQLSDREARAVDAEWKSRANAAQLARLIEVAARARR